MFNSETPSGQNSAGTDASHRGDSSQHTVPLPTSALLPSDTPIAPTPEQVNSHVGQDVGLAPPHMSGRDPRQCGDAPQGAQIILPVREVRLREMNSLAQSHTAQQRQSWDSSSGLSDSRQAPSCTWALLRAALRGALRAAPEEEAPLAAAAPHSCCGLLTGSRKISFQQRFWLETVLKHLNKSIFFFFLF